MIKGIQDVYYNVADMGRAVRFYSEVLNMKKAFGDEHWTILKCEDVSIGLHWTEGNEVLRIERDAHGAHAGATITLLSDDVPNDRKRLEQAGAKILGEANQPWGHMLVFEDLDGNVLKLMNPKY